MGVNNYRCERYYGSIYSLEVNRGFLSTEYCNRYVMLSVLSTVSMLLKLITGFRYHIKCNLMSEIRSEVAVKIRWI